MTEAERDHYKTLENRCEALIAALQEGIAILETGHDYDVMLLRSLYEWAWADRTRAALLP